MFGFAMQAAGRVPTHRGRRGSGRWRRQIPVRSDHLRSMKGGRRTSPDQGRFPAERQYSRRLFAAAATCAVDRTAVPRPSRRVTRPSRAVEAGRDDHDPPRPGGRSIGEQLERSAGDATRSKDIAPHVHQDGPEPRLGQALGHPRQLGGVIAVRWPGWRTAPDAAPMPRCPQRPNGSGRHPAPPRSGRRDRADHRARRHRSARCPPRRAPDGP